MERRKRGTGSISPKGYVRMGGGLEHRKVWRKYHGPVPTGLFIHHLDGDKKNNDIRNLVLIDSLTHRRLHTGCELRDGEWWKPCRGCGEMKPVSTEYYKRRLHGLPAGISPRCRACIIKESTERTKLRKKEKALRAPHVNTLRTVRESRGLSVRELAEAAVVSVVWLRLLEHGTELPNPDLADRLAAVLGVEVHELWPPSTS